MFARPLDNESLAAIIIKSQIGGELPGSSSLKSPTEIQKHMKELFEGLENLYATQEIHPILDEMIILNGSVYVHTIYKIVQRTNFDVEDYFDQKTGKFKLLDFLGWCIQNNNPVYNLHQVISSGIYNGFLDYHEFKDCLDKLSLEEHVRFAYLNIAERSPKKSEKF